MQHERFARRHAAEDAAEARALRHVLAAAHRSRREPRAECEARHRANRQERVGESCLGLAVDRFAERWRTTLDAHFDEPARRIAFAAKLLDIREHLLRSDRIGAAQRVVLDRLGQELRRAMRPNLQRVRRDAQRRWQDLAREHARDDAAQRLAPAAASTAAMVAVLILLRPRLVGMPWPHNAPQRVVVLRPRVLIAHEHADRHPRGLAFKHARHDLGAIAFLALRSHGALPRTTPRELGLEVRFRERQTRGNAIDDDAERLPVRFTERREAEDLAEGVAGHQGLRTLAAHRAQRASGSPPSRAIHRDA